MTVRLRKLEEKDAPFMLEWMLDPIINCFFRYDFSNATVDSCIEFIKSADDQSDTKHFAIVDDSDEYLGTISLKNITENDAEYAISTRKKAHGTGIALEATKQILNYSFGMLGLQRVYLNVLVDNKRANAFYKKAGFEFWHLEKNAIEINGEKRDLNWFYIDRKEE